MSIVDDSYDRSKIHPKRLDEETAEYLLQIDIQWNQDADEDETDTLVANVLEEIKLKTASAACDRRTHPIIEKICFAASLKNLVEIFDRFAPYAVFLSRNRHSSHVLQAAMARIGHLLRIQGLGDFDSDRVSVSILSIVSPILQVRMYNIVHITSDLSFLRSIMQFLRLFVCVYSSGDQLAVDRYGCKSCCAICHLLSYRNASDC